MTLIDLSALQTEGLNPRTTEIDCVSTVDLCHLINEEDALVAPAVAKCIPVIAGAVDAVASRVRHGGRLIYVGAGTSGRLGVVDASEIPPTFSAPHGQFIALMAGGDAAMRVAQEGAEDDTDAPARDLAPLRLDPELDSLIGIAASGRTPYVLSALAYAKNLGCITIGLACSEPSAMSSNSSDPVDFMISPVTGPEVVAGSTRMKAGTATKLVLNMLSTGIMIKIGKTYGNMMVDLKASNLKLKQRSRNIIRKVGGPSCPSTDEEIDALLTACDGSVKLSLATLALRSDPEDARTHLEEVAGGKLSMVLQNNTEGPNTELQTDRGDETLTPERSSAGKDRLIMYIDGGGSKCAAIVVTACGQVGEGEAGPCNVTDVGINTSIASIKLAAQRALDSLNNSCLKTTKPNLHDTEFVAVWIGLAGHDRPGVAASLYPALSKIFRISESGALRISNDIDVLATAGNYSGASNDDMTDSAIVLIAGTGSVCMRYTRERESDIDEYSCNGRSGGWGHLLGDDGGGFDLGRQAIREALYALDEVRITHAASSPEQIAEAVEHLPRLSKTVIRQFCPPGSATYDPLSAILKASGIGSGEAGAGESDAKSNIARMGRLVLEAAEGSNWGLEGDASGVKSIDIDPSAQAILARGIAGLTRIVRPHIQDTWPADCATLVLSGSLLTGNHASYRTGLLSELEHMGIKFRDVRVVRKPAMLGAQVLTKRYFGILITHDV